MQLVAGSKCGQHEGDVVSLETSMCSRLEDDSRTVPTCPSPPPADPHYPDSIHSEHHLPVTLVPCGTSTNDIPGTTRKRKYEEDDNEARAKLYNKEMHLIQLKRKLILVQRKLKNAGLTGKKIPLCYLYGDLLLFPTCRQGGGQGLGRSAEPDLSTPIDSSHSLEASSQAHNKTPPLYHVQDHVDTHTLEKAGLNSEWFASVLHSVISDLNEYGFCVVDGLLGAERAEQILGEVKALHSMGVFQAGQVVSQHVQAQARGMIRGDDITWVTGTEPQCSSIGQLVSVVDALVARANRHRDAGKLAEYNITWRTRAMVACYPGRDTHYVKHVDNPNGDGRCITAIYYLNKDWTAEDGGILRILPENYRDQIVAIEPCFDRMLFFWSDRRNPHEVLPAKITRYAITVWYLDQKEREDYLARGDRAHT